MSNEGFVAVNDLLKVDSLRELNTSTADVENAVRNCPKQRFTLRTENGQLMIRATQGHTIKTIDHSKIYRPITLNEVDSGQFPLCIHGTNNEAWHSIQESGGLSPMKRTHIHFSQFRPNDSRMISGMRSNCTVLIHIDLRKSLSDNVPFVLSENGVILCEGLDINGRKVLPLEYVDKVERKVGGSWKAVEFTNRKAAG